MDILWRIYRKYGYKYTIARRIVYIVLRALFMFVCQFLYVHCDGSGPIDYRMSLGLVYSTSAGCFYIFDFIQFVHCSRKFHLHLKSREKEIRLFYFDKKAYLDSKYIRIHFQVATTIVAISLFFFTFGNSFWELLEPSFDIIEGLHQDIEANHGVVSQSLISYVCFPSIIIYKILININYLYILLIFAYKSFRKRQDFANINNKIRPLIEKYHNNLDRV